jgi:hypothetical protein
VWISVDKENRIISVSINKHTMLPVDNLMITDDKGLITSWTRKRGKSYPPY